MKQRGIKISGKEEWMNQILRNAGVDTNLKPTKVKNPSYDEVKVEDIGKEFWKFVITSEENKKLAFVSRLHAED